MRWSSRTGWQPRPDPVRVAFEEARDRGLRCFDLTCSNPTAVGFHHDAELYRRLDDASIATYRPEPFGPWPAREAVARYYAQRGVDVDPERIWLCASTSEAYAQLFCILCDPGDALAVPRPGYPLLDVLGDLGPIELRDYPLHFDGRWSIDLDALRQLVDRAPQLRAIVAVAPNNPTGNYLARSELQALDELASAYARSLIIDEVFADYPLGPTPADLVVRVNEERPSPTFVVSGLSKIAALPQLKLSWIVMHGPATFWASFRRRAEIVADTFLSVSAPVSHALPSLLEAAPAMQARIRERLEHNLEVLRAATRDTSLATLPVQAGWTVLVRLPALGDLDDEGWAVELARHGVLTQPGFLYDLPAPPRLALSLLSDPDVWQRGVQRLCEVVAARVQRS